ncbi:MAG: SUMF1/EgtB/PvdO family nonheme iron enzyme [Planctomycetes bacterium]|nr:SUMF1/EgtB/PvdO family nonheme iron enzyme [Planctomycetota bacterium]
MSAPPDTFLAGGTYELRWRQGGAVVVTTAARAVAPTALSVQVPWLPAGDYELDGDTGPVAFRAVCTVLDNPPVPMPDAVPQVAAFRADLELRLDQLRQQVLGEPDSGRREERLFNLASVATWCGHLGDGLAWAPAEDVVQLAMVLAANPGLQTAGPPPARPGFSRLAAVAEAIGDLGARYGHGAAAVAAGLFGFEPFVVELALVASGLLAMTEAVCWLDPVLAVPCLPRGGFVVTTALPTLGAAGDLVFVAGRRLAVPLRAQIELASPTAADATVALEDAQALFAALDGWRAFAAGLDPALAEKWRGAPAAVAAEGTIEWVEVDAQRLELLAQPERALELALAAGVASGTGPAGLVATVTVGCELPGLGRFAQPLVTAVAPPPAGMVAIEPGTFTMGGGSHGLQPPHQVTLTRPFWMAPFEVTQAEFAAVIGSNPSAFLGPQRPVERITLAQAKAYAAARTAAAAFAGQLPSGYVLRPGRKGRLLAGSVRSAGGRSRRQRASRRDHGPGPDWSHLRCSHGATAAWLCRAVPVGRLGSP